jgi:hypothetical protein
MLSKSKYVVLSISLMFVSDFPSIGSNGRERKREREKERKRKKEVVCCVLLSVNELEVVRSRFSPQSRNAKKKKKKVDEKYFLSTRTNQ